MRATKFATIAAAAVFAFSLSACGGEDAAEDTAAAPAPAATSAMPEATTAAPMTEGQFGPGCAAVPTDPANPGSFDAMAKEPVATAASGNPLLSTLVTAVKKANLVDSLNSAQDVTVFTPTNDGLVKIP